MAFPASPVDGQAHTEGGVNYTFNATKTQWIQTQLGAASGTLAGTMSAADFVKLAAIAPGAEVNVQSDWTQTTTTDDAFIVNKPVNATGTVDGFMSAADKAKLDALDTSTPTYSNLAAVVAARAAGPAAGEPDTAILTNGVGVDPTYAVWDTDNTPPEWIEVGAVVGTNIAEGTRTATTVPIESSTGTNGTLSVATATLAGVMSATDKVNVDRFAADQFANGNPKHSVTAAAPATPELGQEWFDPAVSRWFKWTDDGTSAYWLDLNG